MDSWVWNLTHIVAYEPCDSQTTRRLCFLLAKHDTFWKSVWYQKYLYLWSFWSFLDNQVISNQLTTFISLVQLLSHAQLFATTWTAAGQASLSITNSWSLLKLMSIELVMPYKHLILCYPLILLPLIFPSIRVFSNESSVCIRWPNDWNYSFSIGPFKEYSGLTSFRIDWFDLLIHQGTLKRLTPQFKSINSLALSPHPYMTTEKTIALTRWTLLTKYCLCLLICCQGWS